MIKKLSVFVIFVFILAIRCNEDDDNNDVFVPTNEWQTVKKGQKIPKGLHVRINLETGQTEAKLLDEDQSSEDKSKALSAVPQENQEEEKTSKNPIPRSTLEEALKKIKGDDPLTSDEIKKVEKKYLSYDEIKKSLHELNLVPKLDAEVIADLLEKHKEVVSAEKLDKQELLKILEDLEFLAHQYNNAHEFVKQNGFQEVVYKNLNSTKVDVRKETLKLMTAILQNNISPKNHALETGSVGILLRLIKFDSNKEVKQRALTALGALLRSFPPAQKKFVESGGFTVLSDAFDSDNIKLQIKLVTLIEDLIVEHKTSVVDQALKKYYAASNLPKLVLENGWCKKMNRLLLGLLITDSDDHDSIEKCLHAMSNLKEHCGDQYDTQLLMNLQQRYEMLSSDGAHDSGDGDSSYYKMLKNLCDNLLKHVHSAVKTEL